MKMCCHLVRLKYQPLHYQPRLEKEKGGWGFGEICNGKPTGAVSHIISHQVPLHRVSPVHQDEAALASLSAGLISELVPR